MTLPSSTRLVHIGPHKTGTTAVQAALWAARPAMLEQGVRHVGRSRNPSAAARAVAEASSPYSRDKPPSISNWNGLVAELRRAREARTIVSSELFAWARPDAIRRIVGDLEPARIHVAVTLRSLARVIPATWQQDVQLGTVTALEDWVRLVLAERSRPFWHLHRHEALVERWLEAVGPDHITAIVVDEADHGFLMRAFEDLLGLRPGTLAPVGDLTNRSLTLPEAEAVRAFNIAYADEGLPRALHARVMRFGAAQHMKRRAPGPDEPSVVLPRWAEAEVDAIQAEIIAGIRATGIHVVGDLERLMVAPMPSSSAGATSPTTIDGIKPEVVGSIAMALLESTGAIRTALVSKGPFKFAEPAEVARVPTYQLVGTVAGRVWRATAGRLVGGPPGRGHPDPGDVEP